MLMAHRVLMLLMLKPKPLFVLEGQLIPRMLEKITLSVSSHPFTHAHIVVGMVTLGDFVLILEEVLGIRSLVFCWFPKPLVDVFHPFGLGNHFWRNQILDKLIPVCLHMILLLPYHIDDCVCMFVIRQLCFLIYFCLRCDIYFLKNTKRFYFDKNFEKFKKFFVFFLHLLWMGTQDDRFTISFHLFM